MNWVALREIQLSYRGPSPGHSRGGNPRGRAGQWTPKLAC